MKNYKYTKTWFIQSEVKSHILHHITNIQNRQMDILEIGCYEGLSSVFWADNLLHHPKSSLTKIIINLCRSFFEYRKQ
jgi:hypothetical protein